jgi:hypothetical protein
LIDGLLLLADFAGNAAWLAVWLVVLVAAVVCIFRRRSGAGACLGVAAILGLALQICGGSVFEGVQGVLSFLPWDLDRVGAAFVRSLGDVVVYALIVAGALLQRPRAG